MEQKESKKLTNSKNENVENKNELTAKQRFIKMIEAQRAFLLELRKTGKGGQFDTATRRIRIQLSNDFYWAYLSKVITYKDMRALQDHMREQLSWESLIGVKQLCFYDTLTDEQLVETMTGE